MTHDSFIWENSSPNTFHFFAPLQLFHFKDKINDISTQASNEATLEVMLNKVAINQLLSWPYFP